MYTIVYILRYDNDEFTGNLTDAMMGTYRERSRQPAKDMIKVW